MPSLCYPYTNQPDELTDALHLVSLSPNTWTIAISLPSPKTRKVVPLAGVATFKIRNQSQVRRQTENQVLVLQL